jgi:hypothetical protein
VCCGIGSNSTQCRDLANDENNCGGCGIECDSGQDCDAYNAGGRYSGRCECDSDSDCPDGAGNDQDCSSGGHCGCHTDNMEEECAAGALCSSATGLTDEDGYGFCYYP